MKDNWQEILMLLTGIWLFISPVVLRFMPIETAAAIAILVGVLMVSFSMISLAAPYTWVEVSILVFGAILLVSPWLMGYSDAMVPTANAAICGLLIVAMSVLAIVRERRYPAPVERQTIGSKRG